MILKFKSFNESLLSKAKDKITNILEPKAEDLSPADFNYKELTELTNLGFVDDKNANHHKLEYTTSNNDKIELRKYWEEDVGFANSIFSIKVNGKLSTSFSSFDNYLFLVTRLIPNIDKDTSKYNL